MIFDLNKITFDNPHSMLMQEPNVLWEKEYKYILKFIDLFYHHRHPFSFAALPKPAPIWIPSSDVDEIEVAASFPPTPLPSWRFPRALALNFVCSPQSS